MHTFIRWLFKQTAHKHLTGHVGYQHPFLWGASPSVGNADDPTVHAPVFLSENPHAHAGQKSPEMPQARSQGSLLATPGCPLLA